MNILDNRFYAVVDRFSNLLILNTFWVISCIPIITIVPATSAMFSVVRQWKLNQDSSVIRNYFRYFKENFSQSFLIGIVWTLFSITLFFNYFYLTQDGSSFKYIIIVPLILVSLLFLGITSFLFSVIAHYKVTWTNSIKSSFFLAIANFPITLLIIATQIILYAVLMYFPAAALIMFSAGAYINFSLCNRVFRKMEQLGRTMI